MKIAPVFLFLALSLAGGLTALSKTPESTISNFISAVQKELFNDDFDTADSLCDSFIKSHPASPVGYLFKAGTLLGVMSDQEEALYSTELRKLIDSVVLLCDKGLANSSGTDAAYLYLWRGHAHVYRSLFESRFGSFTSAIKNGFRAHDDYRVGLNHDSTLYDLYFGLGNYHYWKSVKAGLLRSIGIVSNDIEKGITELFLVIDSGEFFSEASLNSLIWIYLNEEKYGSAIVVAEDALLKYPESRTLRWPMALACFKNEWFEESAELHSYLREYFNQNRGNYFNLIECDYYLYQCYQKLEQIEKADSVLIRVNEYRRQVPKATQRRQLSKLNFLRRELGR